MARQLRAAGLAGGEARSIGHGLTKIERGKPHRLTALRIAELHRWQMLGSEARRGMRQAQKMAHHERAFQRHGPHAIAGLAHAAAWGMTRTLMPTSLVTPVVPGYQPGDRIHLARRGH